MGISAAEAGGQIEAISLGSLTAHQEPKDHRRQGRERDVLLEHYSQRAGLDRFGLVLKYGPMDACPSRQKKMIRAQPIESFFATACEIIDIDMIRIAAGTLP